MTNRRLLVLGLATLHITDRDASAVSDGRQPVRERCIASMPLAAYAMTYDSHRQRVLMFGGVGADGRLRDDLWAWDGHQWQCEAVMGQTAPSPRSAAALTYDSRRRVLVVYGGRGESGALRDTWELGASGWVLANSDGPTPDPHGALAYDSLSSAVLLYHSLGDDGPTRATWQWDGHTWNRIADGPNEEFPNAMLGSTARKPALLVTARPTTQSDAFAPPLYEWREQRWHPITVSGPVPHFSPLAPTARTNTGIVLYAGFEPDGSVATWILRDSVWHRHTGASPSRRRGVQIILDPIRSRVVLHGGDDGTRLLNETWEWDGRSWTRLMR